MLQPVGPGKHATGNQSKWFNSTLKEKNPPKRISVAKQHNETKATTILTPAMTVFGDHHILKRFSGPF